MEEPQQAKMEHEESKQDKKHEEPNKDKKHEETKEVVTQRQSMQTPPNKNNQEGQEGTPKGASASSSSPDKQNEKGQLSTWFAFICVFHRKEFSTEKTQLVYTQIP